MDRDKGVYIQAGTKLDQDHRLTHTDAVAEKQGEAGTKLDQDSRLARADRDSDEGRSQNQTGQGPKTHALTQSQTKKQREWEHWHATAYVWWSRSSIKTWK